MIGPATRRRLIRRGIAGGVALAAAGVPAGHVSRHALADSDADARFLETAIELELRTAVLYESLAGGEALEEEVRRAAELFAEQEREHAEALTAALEDLGGTAPEPPRPADIEGLSAVGAQREALELAMELENQLVAKYVAAAGPLESTAIRRTAAQILGNEAQHLVVLRQQLGREPVPDAFEDGESG